MNKDPTAPLIMAVFIVTVYLLPWIVAILRQHNNRTAILALNLLLGWTFVFWAVAMVWAFTDNRRQRPEPAPRRLRAGRYEGGDY